MFPHFSVPYNIHILDMDGTVIHSTAPLLPNGDSIAGKSYNEILLPGDAAGFRWALLKAALGLNYQWHRYGVMDHVFLSLIEHMQNRTTYSIYEVEMKAGNNTKACMDFLYAASGYYSRQPIPIPAENIEAVPLIPKINHVCIKRGGEDGDNSSCT
jgi:hypothetical protein